MIAIARHTDYAARLILHLASLEPGARTPIAVVARQRRLPLAFVRRTLAPLVRAGIIETVRGQGGGIRLGRPAARISLLDLVRVMEGGVVLNPCVDTPMACPLAVACPVNKAWCEATDTLSVSLGAVRFDRLANATEAAVATDGYPRRSGRRSQPSPPAGRRRPG